MPNQPCKVCSNETGIGYSYGSALVCGKCEKEMWDAIRWLIKQHKKKQRE